MGKFIDELEATLEYFESPEYFVISDRYSAVYNRFLKLDLSNSPAIRGQMEEPISFGFRVVGQDDKPMLFNDTVRSFMLEFIAKKVNTLSKRLREKYRLN